MFIGKYNVLSVDIHVGARRDVRRLFAATKCLTLTACCQNPKAERAKTMISKMAIWAVALSGALAVKLVCEADVCESREKGNQSWSIKLEDKGAILIRFPHSFNYNSL